MKAIDMHWVLQRLQQEARQQRWKDRLVSLLLIVCDLLSVSFGAVCMSACEEMLSYSSADSCCISAVILNITFHIAYKILSHVYILIFWEEVKLAFVVSTTRCIYSVQFHLECGPDHLLKWFERSDYIHLESISNSIYTWSFQDRIAIDAWSDQV